MLQKNNYKFKKTQKGIAASDFIRTFATENFTFMFNPSKTKRL